jgi:hypothetical protein
MADRCQAGSDPASGLTQLHGPGTPLHIVIRLDRCGLGATQQVTSECECGCTTSWRTCWPCAVQVVRQVRTAAKAARCVRCSLGDIPGGRPHQCLVTLTVEGDAPAVVTT